MWLVDLLASMAPVILSRRKTHNGDELAEALSGHALAPDDIGRRLLLEEIFFEAYGKRASSELIMKMANSTRGPGDAFELYRQSTGLVGCDYEKHLIKMPKGFGGRQFQLMRIACWGISLILASLFTVIALYAGFFSLKMIWSVMAKGISALELDDFLITTFSVFLTVLGVIFGTLFGHLSISFKLNKRYTDTIALASEISSSDNSST